MPVSVMWSNGGEAVGFIPTRYPGTAASADGALLLARRTDWVDAGAETFRGIGQRMLATSDNDYALLDLRSLELDTAQPADEVME
jgi:type VI secretion system protein ImpE